MAITRIPDGKGDGVSVPRLIGDGMAKELEWQSPHTLDQALAEVMNTWRAEAGLPLLSFA